MAYQPELEKLERRYQEDPGRNFAQLAESYRKLGRIDDALDVLRAHLTDRPNYVSGLVVLGRCLLDQQNDAEARETFERVLAVDGEHIIALKALGELSERAQQIGAARGWYQRLLDIDPMNGDAAAALARLPAEGVALEATPTPALSEAEASEAPGLEVASAAGAEAAAGPPFPPPADIAPAWTPPMVGGGVVQAEPVGSEARRWEAPASLAAEIRHEELPPGAELEVRSGLGDDMTIERASSEYVAEPAALEPVPVERISEVELPVAPEAEEAARAEGAVEEPEAEPAAPVAGGEAIAPLEAAGTPAESAIEAPEAVAERLETVPEAEALAAAAAALADDARWIEQDPDLEPITLEGHSEADELVIEAFDESLGWDAGERVSHQISSEDLEAAERLHEASLENPVEEILDHAKATLPDAADAAVLGAVPVEGLEVTPAAAPEVTRVEGFETHAADAVAPGPGEPAPTEPGLVAEAPLLVDAAEVAAQEALRQEADRRASLAGLPVFVPEEEEPAPLVVEAEPEPVVTETMAELYARQGLTAEARDLYRKLLERRPGDARLMARLAELEAPSRPLAQPTIRYLAVESGGQRARDFLADVLSARGGPATVSNVGLPAPDDHGPGLEPMDEAFAEEPTEIRGQPTQPAADEVSLAAIFGEAPPAAPPPPEAERGTQAGAERPTGGFSFDDLFGKGSAPAAEPSRPARDTLADDEGDDVFRDWLKSLKS